MSRTDEGTGERWRRSPAVGALLIAGYVACLVAPLLIAWLSHMGEDDELVSKLGRGFALAGAVLLAMQLVLAARLRGVFEHYGLDAVLRFHRRLAVAGVLLILAHPILLAAGDDGWSLLTSLRWPWYILLGKAAMVVLLIQVGTSLWRNRMRLRFEKWRMAHNLAPALLALVFLHSWAAGTDLQSRPLRSFWVVAFAAAVTAYLSHRLRMWQAARRRAYRVTDVTRETPNVWTLGLAPIAGVTPPRYLPGQFHFLRLYRGDRYDGEEHPFTIVSSPTESGRLRSTIKESGDFTATIGGTKPGARVGVQGPFGRFSYLLHPQQTDLVFIAGGIGITPLMSMLRHMKDTAADADVLLLYGNRTEEDIAFRDELERISGQARPRLRVVHILSQAGEGWQGEAGYVDRSALLRHCGADLQSKRFYACGPPLMMRLVTQALRELGVSPRRIHSERFVL